MRRSHDAASLPTVPPDLWQQIVRNLERHASRHNQQVREQLRELVLGLSRPQLKRLIGHLLINLGYSEVRLLRPAESGADITAKTHSGLTDIKVAVRIRNFASPIHRHLLDELCGLVWQTHAQHGLFLTTSIFSRLAKKTAGDPSSTPLTLVDGMQLLDLLVKHEIGVRREMVELDGEARLELWRLDKSFWKVFDVPFRSGEGLLRRTENINAISNINISNQGDANNDTYDKSLYGNLLYSGGGMTWRTHVLSGVSTLWLLQLLPNGLTPHNAALLVAVAALGALLPDLDASESKIKHLRLKEIKSLSRIEPFAPLSTAFSRSLGHRGLLHSLLGLSTVALLAACSSVWWGWPASLALVLGYGAHLAGDACTRSGIPWLYPSKRRYHILPSSLRFVTGSLAEETLFPILFAAVALLLLRVTTLILSQGGV